MKYLLILVFGMVTFACMGTSNYNPKLDAQQSVETFIKSEKNFVVSNVSFLNKLHSYEVELTNGIWTLTCIVKGRLSDSGFEDYTGKQYQVVYFDEGQDNLRCHGGMNESATQYIEFRSVK